MYDFDKIKLVIWDLDETLWKGTLSEESITIPHQNLLLVEKLTDAGIVNSICSKNDEKRVIEELKKHRIEEYFVFLSVNWESKGYRVKQLIKDMKLRDENVLFLDDNPSNREEVKYFNPNIMVEGPDCIPGLLEHVKTSDKTDLQHKRLKQYKILEKKRKDATKFQTNEDFLLNSHIQVEINHNCVNELDRIHELILRSNQLNFTKKRSSKEELLDLIRSEDVDCGYVSVKDRFGDYGIIGFYAIKNNACVHFTFSCRTLGMGIEQYVYNILGRPTLNIVDEVVSDLSSEEIPAWINQNKTFQQENKKEIHNLKEHSVLIKGPCDLFQMYPYIANTDLFDTEFTYTTNKGLVIESTGHTTNITESLRLSKQQKEQVLQEVPFMDPGMFNMNIFEYPYKVVVISILTDANLGVYQRKTGQKFAFLEYQKPLTDKENWDDFIHQKCDTRGFQFTKEILENFSENYTFIGRNTPEKTVENLQYIRRHLDPDCLLIVMLGGELYYEKNNNPAYDDRHIVHKEMNDAIRRWSKDLENVQLLDVNKYLVDQSSFYDHFNHYIKPVYYSMASDLVEMINHWTGSEMKEKSKLVMVKVRIKEALAPTYYKMRKLIGG